MTGTVRSCAVAIRAVAIRAVAIRAVAIRAVAIRAVAILAAAGAVTAPSSISRAQNAPQRADVLSDRYVIAIHGGTLGDPASMSAERRAAAERTLTRALRIGQEILQNNGRSLDAVEQVIRFLEDDPTFNAGKGAVLNSAGVHELDASIMDGRTRQCGAVAAVKTVKNPISLARLVMSQTRHVLLVGDGAEQFAVQRGVDPVDNKYFSTPERIEELRRAQAADPRSEDPASAKKSKTGTVGCVVLDKRGHLAAGTSTGGLNNKLPGRVGDSPVIGAGTFADDETCAVSCTGIGEQFIRHAVAYDIAAQLKYARRTLPEAVAVVMRQTLRTGDGGLIAVGHDGQVTAQFNTAGMSRAIADHQGRFEVHVGP